MDHFLWHALQSVEKYLKAIILYNDGYIKKINHNLVKALEEVTKMKFLEWDFTDAQMKFLEYLTKNGPNRYFIHPSGAIGNELQKLDDMVWSIRRYCEYLQILKEKSNKNREFEEYIHFLQSSECVQKANKFRLRNTGFLEEVLDTKKHIKMRENLIWKNFKYGTYKKHRFSFVKKAFGKSPTHFFSLKYILG